ncbi:hypothetical protein TUM17563_22970 [Klebsiella oxytoca]|nr:hypothetical protein TUM17563_22970 [Klebsiella oxytoca]
MAIRRVEALAGKEAISANAPLTATARWHLRENIFFFSITLSLLNKSRYLTGKIHTSSERAGNKREMAYKIRMTYIIYMILLKK